MIPLRGWIVPLAVAGLLCCLSAFGPSMNCGSFQCRSSSGRVRPACSSLDGRFPKQLARRCHGVGLFSVDGGFKKWAKQGILQTA